MSTYMTAKQVEAKLQETRREREFTGKVEKEAVKVIVETAKRNGNFGDKTLVCIDPVYVHIPVWQRKLYVPAATTIGENYNRHKWEVPKVLYLPSGKLICVDGMHRLYGAFLGRIETVTVELITDLTEKEAIQLFLDQTARRPMSPADTYKAGVKAGRADCLALKEIAHRYHIVIRGDEEAEKNPIGVLTSVSDGIVMARKSPVLLNKIFEVITDLNWSAGKYSSKAYSAKTIRALKALYSKYESSETLMAEALLSTAKGSEYFANHLALLCQDKLFDTLDELVSDELSKTSGKAEQLILNI